jgi:hypothetical protein
MKIMQVVKKAFIVIGVFIFIFSLLFLENKYDFFPDKKAHSLLKKLSGCSPKSAEVYGAIRGSLDAAAYFKFKISEEYLPKIADKMRLIEIPKDQNVVMSTDLSWWDYDIKNISILFGRGTPNEICYRLAYDRRSQMAYFTYTEF